MATLVINVLPWDPAHHPSGVPSHFVPFEFVLEEVLPFLPTESLVVKEVSVMAGALVDCVTFSYERLDRPWFVTNLTANKEWLPHAFP